jgi:membrane protein
VVWAIPEDRVLSTAGSVAFFALLAVFPALTTVVSLYGFFADAGTISAHLALLEGVVPAGVLACWGDELTRIAASGATRSGSPSSSPSSSPSGAPTPASPRSSTR